MIDPHHYCRQYTGTLVGVGCAGRARATWARAVGDGKRAGRAGEAGRHRVRVVVGGAWRACHAHALAGGRGGRQLHLARRARPRLRRADTVGSGRRLGLLIRVIVAREHRLADAVCGRGRRSLFVLHARALEYFRASAVGGGSQRCRLVLVRLAIARRVTHAVGRWRCTHALILDGRQTLPIRPTLSRRRRRRRRRKGEDKIEAGSGQERPVGQRWKILPFW